MFPTVAASDVILLVGAIWVAWKWWMERKDKRAEVIRVKDEALATVRTLQETVIAKNAEISEHLQDKEDLRHDLVGMRSDRDHWYQRAINCESAKGST